MDINQRNLEIQIKKNLLNNHINKNFKNKGKTLKNRNKSNKKKHNDKNKKNNIQNDLIKRLPRKKRNTYAFNSNQYKTEILDDDGYKDINNNKSIQAKKKRKEKKKQCSDKVDKNKLNLNKKNTVIETRKNFHGIDFNIDHMKISERKSTLKKDNKIKSKIKE